MRAIGRRIQNPSNQFLGNGTNKYPFLISSSFSSSSGAGRGRGSFNSVSPTPDESTNGSTDAPPPPSLGHGRGRPPMSSDPTLPSFSTFMSSVKSSENGAGRGRVSIQTPISADPPAKKQSSSSGKPLPSYTESTSMPPSDEPNLPESVVSVLSGAGWGKPAREAGPQLPTKEENRTKKQSSSPGKPLLSYTESTSMPHPDEPNLPESVVSVLSGAGRGKPAREAGPQLQTKDENRTKKQSFSPGKPLPSYTESTSMPHPDEPNLPESVVSVLSGAGRGKPAREAGPQLQTKEENRHLETRSKPRPVDGKPKPKLSPEEAVKKAISILTHSGGGGRGRIRRPGYKRPDSQDETGDDDGFYVGNDADGEKLANKLGPEIMNKFAEGFEEMSSRVLPSPMHEAYVDALDYNCRIEFEPEYLMGEFDRNPDIDEKPPMSLRDALEKVKPFMMAYEGLQSHEEWDEAVEETMKIAPLLKEIVDHYSGPDTVTAKQQHEELERVAKTIPDSVPDSVKRFADRAVLSLQSNPGWGFDKKCQFMDKMSWEICQHYNPHDKKPSLQR